MNHLTLTLKVKPDMRIDMSPVNPENLRGKKLTEVKKIKVQSGNERLKLDSLFKMSGNTNSDIIIIKKSNTKLDFIGHAMRMGIIKVSGSTGDYLGKDMSGGSIVVSGSVGQWTGSGMKNAHIEIKKDAGDYLGAVFSGKQHGMKGGIIHVHGNAGARVGERMRRGIIAIEGDVGEYCGCRMLAGTILVLGKADRNIGTSMKRGSIILAERPVAIPATFNNCGTFELSFLSLIFKELLTVSRRFKFLEDIEIQTTRIVGDLSVVGKGELLILT